jgi:hypothetical protein
MKKHDSLKVRITKIKNADVYIAFSKRYRWLNHLDRFFVEPGEIFTINSGLEFYVVGIGNAIFPGSFRVQTWVEKQNDPGPPKIYKAPNLIKTVKPTPAPTKPASSTTTNTQT